MNDPGVPPGPYHECRTYEDVHRRLCQIMEQRGYVLCDACDNWKAKEKTESDGVATVCHECLQGDES